jgi:hypothetical protein
MGKKNTGNYQQRGAFEMKGASVKKRPVDEKRGLVNKAQFDTVTDPSLPDGDSPGLDLQKATGAKNDLLAAFLLLQAHRASVPEAALDKAKGRDLLAQIRPVEQVLLGIAPKDELEGILAVQMVSVHNVAMRLLERASRTQLPLDTESRAILQAQKLMRTFVDQLEALNRYRGKGQQKVTVEHVTVNHGGQAIVGSVETKVGGG